MVMNLILIWELSPHSHSGPYRWQSVADGSISNDELPIAAPTGVHGCALLMPLAGELAGTSDPSTLC